MKILYLAASNSIHSLRWIKYFFGKGHKIFWVSLAPPIAEAKDFIKKVQFYEIKPSPLSDINGLLAICYLPLAVLKFRKFLKIIKPDLIHIHSAGVYGLVGALSGFQPIILTPWGSDILLTSSLFKKCILKFILKRAILFTCDGENTFKKLIELGVDAKKIRLIRFGTDVEKFKIQNSKFKITDQNSKIKIISLRNLEPVYNVETLIKAAAIVAKKYSEVEFIIAGDGSERTKLEQMANSLGLISTDIVKFIGRYNYTSLPQILNEAHIYVSTSLSDSGLAASTAEAMASGLAVIVSESGDNAQWVIDNKGGFVIPVRSPEALAEKIIYLLKNKNLLKDFGEYNRKIIEEKNNYYKEMGKMEKLYEEIASQN